MYLNNSIRKFKFHDLVWKLDTWLELGDTLANALNCSSALVAQDDREKSFRVTATQSVGVCVTHPCSKDLTGTGSFKDDVRRSCSMQEWNVKDVRPDINTDHIIPSYSDMKHENQTDNLSLALSSRKSGMHTLMRTSWAFGGATSTSSMERGFPGSQATAALHLIT